MSRHIERAPAERWQHGVDREVSTHGSEAIAKPVRALVRAKRIGDAEVAAAERFYRAYAFGLEGSANDERTGPSGSPSPDGAMVARVDAMFDYSSAMRGLSLAQATMVYAIVIEERSIFGAAEGSGHQREKLKVQAADALKALADFYSRRDGSRGGYNNA